MNTHNSTRLAFAAAVLLAGTSLASAQDLTFWTLNSQSQAANDAIARVAAEFSAANPGVNIEVVTRGVDDHKTALRVAAGSDRGPDIFFSWAGPGLGGEYIDAGLSLPLDDYYAQYGWDDELVPTAASFSRIYEGGRHGVPFTFKGEALYYNMALFEQAGVTEEPTTYEELIAAADKLKAAGIPAITFGGSVNWHVMRLMDVILEAKCGAEMHDQLTSMTVSWATEPCALESFAELDKWSKNYILSPYMGIDNNQSFNLFIGGRAAMMLEGDWLVQQLDEAGDLDNYGIFPFPTGTDRLYGFAEYLYISSKSQNPDIAAQFLDYFISTEVQQSTLGSISTTSVNSNVTYADMRALDEEWLGIFDEYAEVYMNGDQAFPLDVTTEYFRVINEVASGTVAPADAVTAMQTFIDNRS